MDSGASNHISGNLNLFSQLKALKGQNVVYLPDGTIKMVQYTGHIVLHSGFILKDVLYIPDFRLNLLLVHKLVFASNMEVLWLEVSI